MLQRVSIQYHWKPITCNIVHNAASCVLTFTVIILSVLTAGLEIGKIIQSHLPSGDDVWVKSTVSSSILSGNFLLQELLLCWSRLLHWSQFEALHCSTTVAVWFECYCPIPVALSPLAVLLVMPCPCLFHAVKQLSTVMLLSYVCGTQSICCLTGNAMPMSVSHCQTVVHCYVAVPCLWHPVHWLPYLLVMPCPCLFHSGQQLSTVMLLPHVCDTQSIGCLTCNAMPMSVSLWPTVVHCYVAAPCLWHPVHWLSYL